MHAHYFKMLKDLTFILVDKLENIKKFRKELITRSSPRDNHR